MKNLYIFLFALLTINSANSQPCLPEGITFTTQEQIDNFQTNYPGCTEIEGDLKIIDSYIVNLNGLNVLNSIGGELRIQACHSLTSLNGLGNLTSVGGELRIIVNSALTSLVGFNTLTSIGSYLYVYSTTALISLNGLVSLNSIGSYLDISNNAALTSLAGLDNLNSIGGDLRVINNDSLTSLTGIDYIEAGSISNIEIYNNSSLSLCGVQSICNYLIAPNGSINIHDNAIGCNNHFQLVLACGLTLPCPQNFTFSEQLEIDNFQIVFPGCTEIEGNILIYGDDITNLDGLSILTYIGGDLVISHNASLTTLSGLENLNTIGGNLSICVNDTLTGLTEMETLHYIGGDVDISDNDALSNLNGLETLDSIGGSLSIGNYSPGYVGNNSLLNLSGLDGLVFIGGDLGIYNNEILVSLTGLENLTSVAGSVFIGIDDFSYSAGNPSLINLSGLEGLTNIGSNLGISYNDTLFSLTGLENVTSIGGYLKIDDNDDLINLTGLESLISIGGNIKIINNDTLNSLSGIDNIDADSIWGIEIHDNPCLSTCAVQSICNFLLAPSGNINIYNNANGCDNPTQVANACGPAWPCFPEGITYSTQEEIDSFQINYPGCNDIGGSVTIVPEDYDIHIKNLFGLNVLTSIGDDLNIRCNDSLVNLSGLENLQSIGGDLIIGGYGWFSSNASLLNLSGLEGLTSISGDIEIIGNPALVSLIGLDNIQSNSITDMTICNNTNLSFCNAQGICNYLSAPTGIVHIYNNSTGCNNPGEIANSCGFPMPCLPYGNYYFLEQEEIDNFQINYPDCGELAGDVLIHGQDITNLIGLNVVSSVNGNMSIYGNPYLTDLDGLGNLDSIGGSLTIGIPSHMFDGSNASLISLNGLENLTTLGGSMRITLNHVLTSLTGLDNIESNSITDINISSNENLSECDVNSVCEYLVSPNGNVEIGGNAPGCNSQDEIEEACNEHCLPEGITFSTQEEIDNFQTIYPGCTEIEGDVTISGVNISNLNGLSVITSIDGYLDIFGNDALTSPVGLDNLTSIGEYLHIYGNDVLSNLNGLNNLSSIDSMLYIDGNAALANMSGLENLTSIGTYLTIFNNDNLSSLNGLENLTSIGGDLHIEFNSSLISINGLENVDAGSIVSIFINDNSLLSSCNIHSVCDFLAIPNSTIVIHDNAPGCNSSEEVQETCPDAVKEIKTTNGVKIIPNPSNIKITISLPSLKGNTLLSIFNISGEKVFEMQLTDTETQLDISALPRGVYFVRLQDENFIETVKMIKQ